MDYYNKSIDELYKELNSNKDGLTTEEAEKRISIYGKNILEEKKKKSKFIKFLEQFNDMMIIILIIVAIIMTLYGIFYSHEYTDPIVIGVVVLLNAIMGFIQEQKAEVTLEGLKKYTNSTCKVKRDGEIIVVDSSLLVPGDIVYFEAGDKVTVDARIIYETALSVDESPLTGESLPVKKIAKKLKGDLQIQDQVNTLFSGSAITNGRVTAIVTKTGMITEIGRIAVSLNTPYEVETPLEKKINEISKKLTILIFIILIFIFIYGKIILHYNFLSIIMLCVSLAVAAIPEGLPAVITITLSSGAAALAKKKTIVRQMTAVETLGSTDIICSDKTGTITQNKMTVKEVVAYNEDMLNHIALLCNDTTIQKDKYIGDPTETCLFEYLKTKKVNILEEITKNKRIIDAPFDSDRKLMSTINIIDNKNYMLVKGSLENLLLACNSVYIDGRKTKLTNALIDEIKAKEEELARKALRVIGFAYKDIKNIPANSDEVIEQEKDLIFVGLVGMIDPPRTSVKDSVKRCMKAGIRPIMITGDSLITASAIAKEVGILRNEEEAVLGSELDQYTDDELPEIVKKYNVYARVSPEHKRRIVNAWQKNGKVVAMTGDGVNDAPAIKDAHVGVGMGITGTEVTKSVADVILLDDSFSTIVVAVEEGRRIYNNIRNNVVYSLSSNFSEIFTILIGMFTGNTILLPIHILFIDLVTDSIPSICLAFEKSEKGIMDKDPRGIDKPIFTPFIYGSIISSSVIETIFVIITFFITKKYYSVDIAMSLALLSLVIQEIVYSFSCRNLKDSLFKQGVLSNKPFNYGILILIVIETLVFLTPIGKIVSVTTIEFTLILKVILFNFIGFILYELSKVILKKCLKD